MFSFHVGRNRLAGAITLWRPVVIAALYGAAGFSWIAEASFVRASESTESDAELVTVAGLEWHTNYARAYQAARRSKRMLLINFVPDQSTHFATTEAARAQRGLEKKIVADGRLRQQLAEVVRARLPRDVKIQFEGKRTRLLSNAAFQHLEGQPGLAIIDLAHEGAAYYGRVVSAFPFRSGKYYRWRPEHLSVALSLPPGTITQRTMIWAVRIHPERPASTAGQKEPQLAQAAASHSQHQANLGVQGHHQWESRFHRIRSMVGAGAASEVVAESWPGENMIDSCIDCVDSWRHSSGHWRAVRRRHRLYGYDIRRGRNGIWYGTGIFAN
jgi:hypothetical protein